MNKLLALAALSLASCVETVVFTETPDSLDLGDCVHSHDAEPTVTVTRVPATISMAKPLEAEVTAVSGPSEAELRGCLAEGDAGCAGCFEMATLVSVGETLLGAGLASVRWADLSALGLWAAGFRTCEAGETPSVRLGAGDIKDSWLAQASQPSRDGGGTRITWNVEKASNFRSWLSSNPGLVTAVAAHEALHMRGQGHDASNPLMSAQARHEPWRTGGTDAVLDAIADLGLPAWSNRYEPAN